VSAAAPTRPGPPRRALPALFAGFAPLFLPGCQQGGGPPAIALQQRPEAEVPDHARRVVAAAVMRLRGREETAIARALGVAGAGRLPPEAGFRYQGFDVVDVRFRRLPGRDDGPQALHALLAFRDRAGRGALTEVIARYVLRGGAVTLDGLATLPLSASAPQVAAHLVPADALRGQLAAQAQSPEALRVLAARRAITPAEARGRDVVALAFLLDRLGPGGGFGTRLSEQAEGTAGWQGATLVHVDPGGFAVAAMPIRIAADRQGPLWLKAVQRGGPTAARAARGETLVGLFQLGSGAPAAG
jgi:hypothetical protein